MGGNIDGTEVKQRKGLSNEEMMKLFQKVSGSEPKMPDGETQVTGKMPSGNGEDKSRDAFMRAFNEVAGVKSSENTESVKNTAADVPERSAFGDFKAGGVATAKDIGGGTAIAAGSAIKDISGEQALEDFSKFYNAGEFDFTSNDPEYYRNLSEQTSHVASKLRKDIYVDRKERIEEEGWLKELLRNARGAHSDVAILTDNKNPDIRAGVENFDAKKQAYDTLSKRADDLRKIADNVEKYGSVKGALDASHKALTDKDFGSVVKKWGTDVRESAPKGKGFWFEAGGMGVQLLGSGAAIAVAPFTRGTSLRALPAILGYTNIGMLTAGTIGSNMDDYEKYKISKGELPDVGEKWAIGLANGMFEFAAEKLRLDLLLPKGVMKKIVKKTVFDNPDFGKRLLNEFVTSQPSAWKKFTKGFLGEAAVQGGLEGMEEVFTHTGQTLVNNAYKDDADDTTFNQYIKGAVHAFAAGALMGGFLGGAKWKVESKIRNDIRKEDGVKLAVDKKNRRVVEVIGRDKGGNLIGYTSAGKSISIAPEDVGSAINVSYDDFIAYGNAIDQQSENILEMEKEIHNKDLRISIEQQGEMLSYKDPHNDADGEHSNSVIIATGKNGKRLGFVVSGKLKPDSGLETVQIYDNETGEVNQVKWDEIKNVQTIDKANFIEEQYQLNKVEQDQELEVAAGEREAKQELEKDIPEVGQRVQYNGRVATIRSLNKEEGDISIELEDGSVVNVMSEELEQPTTNGGNITPVDNEVINKTPIREIPIAKGKKGEKVNVPLYQKEDGSQEVGEKYGSEEEAQETIDAIIKARPKLNPENFTIVDMKPDGDEWDEAEYRVVYTPEKVKRTREFEQAQKEAKEGDSKQELKSGDLVMFNGELGEYQVDEGGKRTFNTDEKIIELADDDTVEVQRDFIVNEDRSVTINGETFKPIEDLGDVDVYDENGEVRIVTMTGADGSQKIFSGSVASQILYENKLLDLEQASTEEIEKIEQGIINHFNGKNNEKEGNSKEDSKDTGDVKGASDKGEVTNSEQDNEGNAVDKTPKNTTKSEVEAGQDTEATTKDETTDKEDIKPTESKEKEGVKEDTTVDKQPEKSKKTDTTTEIKSIVEGTELSKKSTLQEVKDFVNKLSKKINSGAETKVYESKAEALRDLRKQGVSEASVNQLRNASGLIGFYNYQLNQVVVIRNKVESSQELFGTFIHEHLHALHNNIGSHNGVLEKIRESIGSDVDFLKVVRSDSYLKEGLLEQGNEYVSYLTERLFSDGKIDTDNVYSDAELKKLENRKKSLTDTEINKLINTFVAKLYQNARENNPSKRNKSRQGVSRKVSSDGKSEQSDRKTDEGKAGTDALGSDTRGSSTGRGRIEFAGSALKVNKEVTLGVAPYRSERVNSLEKDATIRNSDEFIAHNKLIHGVAKELDIKINGVVESWGGYVDLETGVPVQEVSSLFNVNGSPENIKTLAAIIGKYAPEKQDSVLYGEYADGGSVEYTISTGNFKNGTQALKHLKENGIEYFTLDKNSGDIIILDFDGSLENNIADFIQTLNDNGITTEQQRNEVNAEFIESGSYGSTIQGARDRIKDRQQNWRNIDAYVEAAKRSYAEVQSKQGYQAGKQNEVGKQKNSLKVDSEKKPKNLDKGGSLDVPLPKIKDYAKQIHKGLAIYQRYSPEEQRGLQEGTQRAIEATLIAGRYGKADEGSQQLEAQGQEIQRDFDTENDLQEGAVERYARSEGIWYDNTDEYLKSKYGDQIDKGGESRVYGDDKRKVVIKSTNTLQFRTLEEFFDSNTLHNTLFPETSYQIIGFGEDMDGNFSVIREQPYVEVDWENQLNEAELDSHMKSLGFKHTEMYNYANPQTLARDLHASNVVRSKKGNVMVIDPILRLNTPDWKMDGQRAVNNKVAKNKDTSQKFSFKVENSGEIDKYGRVFNGGMDKAIEFASDKMRAVKKLQEIVIKNGGHIVNDANPYKWENLIQSRSKAQIEEIKRTLIDPLMVRVKSMAISGSMTEAQLQNYLIAKHAIERNAYFLAESNGENVNASGMSDSDAQRIIDSFEKNYSQKEIDSLWGDVQALTDYTLERWKSDGFLSQEDYDSIKSRYKNYVPLRGWEGETAADIYDYVDSDQKRGFNPNVKARGRKTISDQPLPYMISMAETSIVAGNKNLMKQKALQMVRNNSSMTDYFKEGKIFHVKDKNGNVNSFIQYVGDKTKHPLYEKNTQKQIKEHGVSVFVDGEERIIMYGDPNVANAINGNNTWLPETSAFLRGSWVGRINRHLSSVFTAKNPAFIPVNYVRDILFAATSHGIKGGVGRTARFLNNNRAAFRAINNNIIEESRNPTNTHSEKEINDVIDKLKNGVSPNRLSGQELRALYYHFKQMGGETGYVHMKDIDVIKHDIDKMMRSLNNDKSLLDKAGQLKAIKAGGKALNYLALMSENASRFSTFLTSLQDGKSSVDAAVDAKNITVNFNRKGRVSGIASPLFAFFNASMQGVFTFMRLAKNHPKAFGSVAAAFMALGALNAMLARMWADDDEFEQDYYEQLPDYVKYNNIVIPNPSGMFGKKDGANDKFILIPLPHGFRSIYALGVMANELSVGSKSVEDVVLSATESMIDTFSPINLTSGKFDNIGSAVRPIIPTAVVPAYDIMVNENFAGRQIFKEPFTIKSGKYTPNSELGKKNVNDAIYKLTQAWNKLGGGDETRPANIAFDIETGEFTEKPSRKIFDINPSAIEHIIEYYAGGTGKFLNNVYKTSRDIIKSMEENSDVEPDSRNIPVARRFMATPYNSEFPQDYWEYGKKVQTFDYYYNMAKKDRDVTLIKSYIQNKDMINMSSTYRSYKKVIDNLTDLSEKATDESVKRGILEQRRNTVKDLVLKLKKIEEKTK